jgi:hypothetical protein
MSESPLLAHIPIIDAHHHLHHLSEAVLAARGASGDMHPLTRNTLNTPRYLVDELLQDCW